MERAVFITKINQLRHFKESYTRLYFGQEFCERLIPSPGDLKEVLTFIRQKGMDFSLVTPYVTNLGLEKLNSLLDVLKKKEANCEIIINDWGVLNLVNRRYVNLTPVLGRLLTKQKRGPRLIELLKRKTKSQFFKNPRDSKKKYLVFQKKLPLDSDFYYKGSNASSVPIIHDFLLRQRIRRIELDNTGQGLFLELPKGRIQASVYLPYVYITTTFFCLSAGCDQKNKTPLKIKSCSKQCQKYVFKLRHKTMPKVIYLKGNSQFYKSPMFQLENLQNSGVDRIVYEPEIPV